MLKKKEKGITAFMLLTVIFILGIFGDIAFYRYTFLGETDVNYEYALGQEESIDLAYTINFPAKTNMIDFNGLIKKLLCQPEMNNITKLKNGYLTQTLKDLNPKIIQEYSSSIIQYNEYCQANDVKLLYIQPAYKVSKFDNQLPIGDEDYSNKIVDELLVEIKDGGVSTIDLRQEMYEDGINQYDYYFRTDHHWTTEGAFYAYQKIARWIADETDTIYDKKLTNLSNYQIDTYEDWHLGMRGQRTGKYYAGIDDFDLIHPDFDTKILNKATNSVGTFDDMVIRWDKFSTQEFLTRYTYDAAYVKNPINDLQSLDAPSDLTVLIYNDSFARALSPYMMLTYSNYYELGTYNSLSLSVIQQYHPDVIIIMPWPGYFIGEGVFKIS